MRGRTAGDGRSDPNEKRLDFSRARFGIVGEQPGSIVLEAFGRDAASGRFRFSALNRADPPESVEVSGSFSSLPYTPDVDISVAKGGPPMQDGRLAGEFAYLPVGE